MRRRAPVFALAMLLTLAAALLPAQQPGPASPEPPAPDEASLLPPVPVYRVAWLPMPPKLDGLEGPGEWDATPWSDELVPLRADAPEDRVAFKLGRDAETLYLLVRGLAPLGEPREEFHQDGFTGGEPFGPAMPFEALDLFVDPRAARADFADPLLEPGHFQVTVLLQNGMRGPGNEGPPYLFAAARVQGRTGHRQAHRPAWWPEGLAVACKAGRTGYVCEVALPFRALARGRWVPVGRQRPGDPPLELPAPPVEGDRWGLQVARRHVNGASAAWAARGTQERPLRPAALQRPFGLLLFDPPAGGSSAPVAARQRRFFSTYSHAAREARDTGKPLLLLVAPAAAAERLENEGYWRTAGLEEELRSCVGVLIDPATAPPGMPWPGAPGHPGVALLTHRGNVVRAWPYLPHPAALAAALRAAATGSSAPAENAP